MKKKKATLKALNREYLKAVSVVTELEKQGFVFDKRMKNALSQQSFAKKSAKPTMKDINYFKSLTKKTNLYKRSKGFYNADNDEMLTVSQGRVYVRKQKALEKKQKRETTSYTELQQKLEEIEGTRLIRGRMLDIMSDKREILNAFDKFVERGEKVTDGMYTKIDQYVAIINLESKQSVIYSAIDGILALLNGGTAVTSGGDFELIGTPYES